MSAAPTLQSFIAGRWLGQHGAQALRSALDGHVLAYSHEERPDFAEAVDYARARGLASLMGMDFNNVPNASKPWPCTWPSTRSSSTPCRTTAAPPGPTAGSISKAATPRCSPMPASAAASSRRVTWCTKGLPYRWANKAISPVVTSWCHGQALRCTSTRSTSYLGHAGKFAPTFLAGMPCIVKPATSTSYLTEAVVRLMNASGLLPEGSLQLVIGSTGDLLDRLQGQDVVTFTGSADTAAKLRVTPNLIRNSVPFTAEADSLNCAILGPDVTPDSEEFDLYIKEVVREMTTKAGQKCTAIRRAIVPARHLDAVATRLRERLSKVVVGDPSLEGVRMGPWPPMTSSAMSASGCAACCRVVISCSAPAMALPRVAKAWLKARSLRQPCCRPATHMPRAAPTISKRSARSVR